MLTAPLSLISPTLSPSLVDELQLPGAQVPGAWQGGGLSGEGWGRLERLGRGTGVKRRTEIVEGQRGRKGHPENGGEQSCGGKAGSAEEPGRGLGGVRGWAGPVRHAAWAGPQGVVRPRHAQQPQPLHDRSRGCNSSHNLRAAVIAFAARFVGRSLRHTAPAAPQQPSEPSGLPVSSAGPT